MFNFWGPLMPTNAFRRDIVKEEQVTSEQARNSEIHPSTPLKASSENNVTIQDKEHEQKYVLFKS
jgi:hypothetical protein